MDNMKIDGVGAIQPEPAIGQPRADIGFEKPEAAARGDAFSKMLGDAIETTVQRPNPGGATSSEGVTTTGAAGDVAEQKDQLLSDVSRPGAPQQAAPSDQVQRQLEDRIMTLYVDLTNYQVAWKIAQRVQQDTTSILRAS